MVNPTISENTKEKSDVKTKNGVVDDDEVNDLEDLLKYLGITLPAGKFCTPNQQNGMTKVSTKSIIDNVSLNKFEKVSLDVIGPLKTTSKGKRYIFVMQDNFTRFCAIVALSNMESRTIARSFMTNWILQFDTPKIIITDSRTIFINNTMKHLTELLRIKHITPLRVSTTNKIMERSYVNLIKYIKRVQKHADWDKEIGRYMLSYNTSIHPEIQCTPYQLAYGRELKSLTDKKGLINFADPKHNDIKDLTSQLSEMRVNLAEQQTGQQEKV